MREYLARNDLVYEKAAERWEEGIPLANGDMGALVWGTGSPLKITLDKYDAWEVRYVEPQDPRYTIRGLRRMIANGEFEEARRVFEYSARGPNREFVTPTRLPMPRVTFDFGADAAMFEARLHLHDALARGEMRFASGAVRWEALVHSDRNVLIVRFEYEGDARLRDFRIALDHLNEDARDKLARWGYPAPESGVAGDVSWLRQEFPAGGEYVAACKRVSEPGSDTLFISVVTHNDAGDPLDAARELAQATAREKAGDLYDSHVAFWHPFWDKCFLTIPDAMMETLFYVELYKLGCSSRPGKYPCTLQGLWTTDGVMPPWQGDYHLDMNVQETYWPVYASNHLELGLPLYERFHEWLPSFRRAGKQLLGGDCAWAHCSVGLHGHPVCGWYTANFNSGNGPWLAHHFWLHWLYSRDETFLRERAYPFMRAFMQAYLLFLEKGDDGRYHVPLDTSWEYGSDEPEAWGEDVTCSLALVRWLAGAMLECVDILGIDDEDAPKWRDVLANLADFPVDEDGLQLWRGQPLERSHRHHSHLMPIHPLGLLTPEGSDEDRDLIQRSLLRLWHRGTGEWTGWSWPWASLIASRAGKPQMAWEMLREYPCFLSPNTFHLNGCPREFGITWATYSPMTLEAGFCAAAAVMEMLLQSWGGVIRVFPAVPEFWHDAAFVRLRAEGAFLVSAKLARGAVEFVRIESEKGGRCVLKNPFDGEVDVRDETSGGSTVAGGDLIEFDAGAGGSYVVTPVSSSPTDVRGIEATARRRPEDLNVFGVKRLPRF